MPFLYRAFDVVCGSPHVWAPGGVPLPFCQRCTGLYVGCVVALATYAWSRPRPTPLLMWLHGGLLLSMLPFGYHWVPQDAWIRTGTGFSFACGLVYFLLLIPLDRATKRRPRNLERLAAVSALGLVAVMTSEARGSNFPAAAVALSWAGFAGLAAYAVLVASNAVLVPLSLISAFAKSDPR